MKIALIRRWGRGEVPDVRAVLPEGCAEEVLLPVGRLAIRDAVDAADAVVAVFGDGEDSNAFRDECLYAAIRAFGAGKRVAMVTASYWRSYPLVTLLPPGVSSHASCPEAFAAARAARAALA